MWKLKNNVVVNEFLEENGIINFTTTCALGNQMDKEVFSNTLKSFNIENYVMPQQVHSNRVKFITERKTLRKVLGADGLITNKEKLALTVLCADCIPLFLFNKENKIIGLIHIGYKGILKGIVKSLCSVLEQKNINIRKTYFFLGPHICGDCYEFDSEEGKKFRLYKNNRLDLSKEVITQLKKYKAKNIYDSPFCTYHQSEIFFSYRNGDINSRMLSLIMIK